MRHRRSHYHCPDGCEHPQPVFTVRPGRRQARHYCGRCLLRFHEWVPCRRCTPDYCPE